MFIIGERSWKVVSLHGLSKSESFVQYKYLG